MATRKKKAKKSTRSKTGARTSRARGPAKKAKTAKRSAKKKAVSRAASAKKTTRVKSTSASRPKKKDQKRPQPATSDTFRNSSGLLAGDLQDLSNVESADSESVDELMEEGHAFEAGVVSGVEESRNREGEEVRTREVLEDDVPGEYDDQ